MNLTPSKRIFPNLDGLRFFSFLGVFLSHAFFIRENGTERAFTEQITDFLHLGRLGVDCFFVLSGFLITWIILEEIGSTGYFKLGYFYLRRILRIWPLYFVIVGVALGLVLFQFLTGRHLSTLPPLICLFTFTLNFFISNNGEVFLFFLVFLWSIAVEEQFYVFWGLIIKFFKKYLVAAIILGTVASIVFRWLYFPDSHMIYYHTLGVFPDFAAGAFLAWSMMNQNKLYNRVQNASQKLWMLIYMVFILSLIFYYFLFTSQAMVAIERMWFALLFACIIGEQCFALNPFIRLGRWPSVNYLGKVSYGLYCYHGILLTVTAKWLSTHDIENGWVRFLILPCVLFLFTTFVASVSYRYLEQPFLRIKKRYH
jgi:peptidoglycan/LPS O-acetylase OafA/YrhL